MSDKTYNGWSSYETWAVALWLDNEEGSQRAWAEMAIECWEDTDDRSPNQFMNHDDNARSLLSTRLRDAHDELSEHPVFDAANGTVYADLLNAALSEVNWHEIAEHYLAEVDKDADVSEVEPDARD